jgi:GST-like protein
MLPNVKRLLDEISARPAAQGVAFVAERYSIKKETDDEARSHMFPQNKRLRTD